MTTERPLDEKIVALAKALDEASIPHAFGGALALAYYAEPRATVDIDVNVFVGPAAVSQVIDAVARLDVQCPRDVNDRVVRDGQVRLRWGLNPVDVFFAYDEFHDACASRRREVPFGEDVISVLSAEDLLVFKVLFDRRKDWLDIEQTLVAQAGDLDVGYIRNWLARLLDAGDPRISRIDDLAARLLGA